MNEFFRVFFVYYDISWYDRVLLYLILWLIEMRKFDRPTIILLHISLPIGSFSEVIPIWLFLLLFKRQVHS